MGLLLLRTERFCLNTELIDQGARGNAHKETEGEKTTEWREDGMGERGEMESAAQWISSSPMSAELFAKINEQENENSSHLINQNAEQEYTGLTISPGFIPVSPVTVFLTRHSLKSEISHCDSNQLLLIEAERTQINIAFRWLRRFHLSTHGCRYLLETFNWLFNPQKGVKEWSVYLFISEKLNITRLVRGLYDILASSYV